jgi:hypothetical protein
MRRVIKFVASAIELLFFAFTTFFLGAILYLLINPDQIPNQSIPEIKEGIYHDHDSLYYKIDIDTTYFLRKF